jgi:cytoskeletal protein CcmA (bactofilin family)
MWTLKQATLPAASPSPEQSRTAPVRHAASVSVQSSLGKNMEILGEISGTEPLFIDCVFLGSISLPDHRLTIGPNAQISADISARDVVVHGKVCGNVAASNLLEIRATGSLIGDISSVRMSLEDGAYFKGTVDILKTESKFGLPETPKVEFIAPKPARVSQAEGAQIHMQPLAQSA